MGTWGFEILDNDLSMDIKVEFDECIEGGLNPFETTAQILESFEEELQDDEDEVIIYITLAVLQLQAGKVLDSIREKAIEFIESGRGIEIWGEDNSLLDNRMSVLSEIKNQLTQK